MKLTVQIEIIGCIVLSLVMCVFLGVDWVVRSNAEGKVFSRAKDCPKVKVALVLGTSKLNRYGSENPYFTYRIDAAAELYFAGKVEYILVSGDNSIKTYDEPTDMKNALISAGIPAGRIYMDYAGFRTLDSMERALKVFGQKEIIVVSQQFHNERAIYLGEHFAMTVYGYNARDVAAAAGFRTNVRERFARVRLFWDILFGIDSKYLGPPVEIGTVVQ